MDVMYEWSLRMQERARHLQSLNKGRGGSIGSASRAIIYSSTSDFMTNPSVLRGAAGQPMSKSPGITEMIDHAC